MSASLYTRAELSILLRISRQAVAKLLGDPPTQKAVGRKLVDAWARKDFTPKLNARLVAEAVRLGITVDTLLQRLGKPYEPDIPLAEIAQKCIDAASEAQRGLGPTLARLNDAKLSAEELVQLGLRDYAAATGKRIKDRWFRELLKRTIVRDAGAEKWDRLEIYLPDRLWRRGEPDALAMACDGIDKIGIGEGLPCDRLWIRIVEYYQSKIEDGEKSRAVKRELLRALFKNAPSLAATPNALRVNFDRKYAAWRNRGVVGIEDKRATRERPESYEFPTGEWDKLIVFCTNHPISVGWQEFLDSPFTSQQTKDAFPHDLSTGPRQVPKWIRRKLKPLSAMLQDDKRGDGAKRRNGSHVNTDPNKIAAGDSDQSDDKTLEILWWEETPNGLWCGQGQLIPWIDERSWFIYGFRLVSDPAYTGFTLRNSWSDKALEWGLPREKIHVENGIWRKSKVFVGSSGDEESDMAIRRLGIRFEHAREARGKVIERVFGKMSNHIQGWPGYAGRNRAVDKWDRIEKQKRLVDSGREHPSKYFLHKSQVMEYLNDLIVKLNKKPMYGPTHAKWIGTQPVYLSPLEAYQEFFTTPLVKIPIELARMVQSNKIETTVGANGIRFNYGRRTYAYRDSAELGRFEGEQVAAWFNPQDPSMIAVTSIDGRNPFVVPLDQKSGKKKEEIQAAYRASQNFEAYHKEQSRVLKPAFAADFQEKMFRYPIVEGRTLATEQEFKRQEEELRRERTSAVRTQAALDKVSRELNVGENLRTTLHSPEQLEALQRMAERKRRHARSEAESAERIE